MFCTGSLRLFGLTGRILREKRPPDQQASYGVRQGKKAPPRRTRSGHTIGRGKGTLRQRARQASRAEMTPDDAAVRLGAMGQGMRASDARPCRICCLQPASAKAQGGLHDLFERAGLGGKKRRLARGRRGRYPACAAAHLSLPSNIIASAAALSEATPGPRVLNLRTGSAGMSGGRPEGQRLGST